MKDDPTITAVREARHRISQSVDHDPRKLVEFYKRLQERHRNRLVSEATEKNQPDDTAARCSPSELANTRITT
jgi:hypothetical protein